MAVLAMALLTAGLAGAWAPSALAAGGTISGTVRDTGGTALSGITVQPGTISSGGFTAVGSSTTTAANGTYTVSVATTGRYAIRFTQGSQAHAAGYYSSSGFVPDAPSATQILVSGAVTGVNAALPAAHGISGTVTGTGSVPVANVTVDALTTSGAVVAQSVTTKSSGSGTYTIHLAPGSYKLRFTDGSTYPTVYYTSTGVTTDLSAASTLVLSGSDLTGKDVQLPAARHITGTVTDASSAPVAGLKVTAGLGSTATNASGAYTLSVPPGQFVVTILDSTNAQPSGYFHAPTDLTTDPAAATTVDVTAGDATADVQLPTGTTVSGTVKSTSLVALGGIDVWLTPVGAVDPLATVKTSVSGTFSIVAAPGSYTVKVMDSTAKYTSGFYRSSSTTGFTKDLSVATHVAISTSPVALSPTIQMPLYATVDRQSGADRYATAANISRGTVPSGAPVVYVATGANFPDALAAAAAAGQLGGPVLLVGTTSIPTVVQNELTRLKPQKIIIAGGTSVVSASVAAALDAYTTGPVLRQSGPDRYATAAAISAATFAPGAHVAYIATGLNFPDALAAAAAAGRLGGPVLLVPGTSIPPVVQTELNRLQPQRIVIAGGTSVVSSTVQSQLAGYTSGSVTRQSGADRYATAAAISAATFAPGAPIAYVATGANFPDALAAAAASARLGGPVLLVGTSSIPAVVQTELNRLKPARIVIAGGTSVVSSGVQTQLAAFLG